MKQIQTIPLTLVILLMTLFLTGCERRGYYDNDEQDIINGLTGKSWERDYQLDGFDDGETYDVHETFTFDTNGICNSKGTRTNSHGEIKPWTQTSRWAYYTPNFSVLYFNSGVYWQIKDLTPTKLTIVETMGIYTDPSYKQEKKVFTAKK